MEVIVECSYNDSADVLEVPERTTYSALRSIIQQIVSWDDVEKVTEWDLLVDGELVEEESVVTGARVELRMAREAEIVARKRLKSIGHEGLISCVPDAVTMARTLITGKEDDYDLLGVLLAAKILSSKNVGTILAAVCKDLGDELLWSEERMGTRTLWLLAQYTNTPQKRLNANLLAKACKDSEMRVPVRALIAAGADVNAADSDGRSGLYLAAGRGDAEMCKLLVACGADVNVRVLRRKTSVLWTAAGSSAAEEIMALLVAHGADVRHEDHKRRTVLHKAAARATTAAVVHLIDSGAAVDPADDDGLTPLHFGAMRNNVAVCRELIARGACVHSVSNDGRTPLFCAASNSASETVGLLLSEGATDVTGPSCLFSAAQRGDLETCHMLLQEHVSPNARSEDSVPALMGAAILQHTQVCQELLAHGADVNAVYTPDGTTALHCAQGATLRALVGEGCVRVKDAAGRSPLWYAVQRGSDEDCETLLAAGAEAEDVSGGVRLLWHAVSHGEEAIAQRLLKHGADPNAAYHGRTCLMLAVQSGKRKLVHELVKRKVDVNARDNNGCTAVMGASPAFAFHFIGAYDPDVHVVNNEGRDLLMMLCSAPPMVKKEFDVTEALLRELLVRNVKVKGRVDAEGWTPLALAASSGHWRACQMLLDKGAPVDAIDREGRTALHHAVQTEIFACPQCLADPKRTVRALLRRGADPFRADALGRTPVALAQEMDELKEVFSAEMRIPRTT